MPKVRLQFEIRGWVTQTVEVPQSAVDEYNRIVEGDEMNGEAGRKLDQLLEPFISYEDIMDQLDDPEEIELTELAASEAA